MLRRRSYTNPSMRVVFLGVALLFAGAFSCTSFGKGRRLAFYNLHTEEKVRVTYSKGDVYNERSLERVSRVLRDHRSGESHPIDPRLLDLLYDLQRRVRSQGPYQVISGYRSPKTNAGLRAESQGVAERSLHMQGLAIDVRLADVSIEVLRDEALRLRRGGVGYYPGNDFVHLDVGRPRSW